MSVTADPLGTLGEALVGRDTVARELGRGGMATVYLARDVRHDLEVAIEVLRPALAAGISVARFEREIQLAASLQQANVVPLISAGLTDDGLPYYTMPFVDGLSLRDRLTRGSAMSVAEVVSVLRDVTRALAYAH